MTNLQPVKQPARPSAQEIWLLCQKSTGLTVDDLQKKLPATLRCHIVNALNNLVKAEQVIREDDDGVYYYFVDGNCFRPSKIREKEVRA